MNSRATSMEAFRSWVSAALSSARVIYAEQRAADATRPALPYLTIEATADVSMAATPHEVLSDTAGTTGFVAKRYARRRATVRVTYYGTSTADAAVDALVTLRHSLRRTLYKTSPAATLRAAGVAVRPAGGILDTTTERSTVYEPGAAQDWHMYYVSADTNDVGDIDTVIVPINPPPEED
jgi:hypothetical protein